MTFEVKPEILTIDEVDGLDDSLNALSANTDNLLLQTNNLGGSIPELSKSLEVTLNSNIFVAVSITNGQGFSLVSHDGVNWTESPMGNGYVTYLAYGNGKFVGVASGTNTAYSTDGLTWTLGTMPATKSWGPIAYGNGRFVELSGTYEGSVTAYSTDGINWIVVNIPSNQYYPLSYGNGKFITTVWGTSLGKYSTDGVNWTDMTMPYEAIWYSIVYDGVKFVALAITGNTAYSNDGITWTVGNGIPFGTLWTSLAYGEGKFVAVANYKPYGAYSTDGISWIQTDMPSDQWSDLTYANGKFVAFGPNARMGYSENGITWTMRQIPGRSYYGVKSGPITQAKTFSEILGVI